MFKKNNFIERSIMSALFFLRESIFAEEYASKKGLLQPLDPRIKVITFLTIIIRILFIRNISVLLFLYLFCLVLACLSRIDPAFFLKRTWVFIPLFSLFIAIPAVFNVFTPGQQLFSFKIWGVSFIITRQGFWGAALFVLRVTVSVSFAVLLSITTRHFELLRVLRIFKIPQVFVMILGMCYRYAYLFVEIIENTYLAVKSRAGTKINSKYGQRVVSWNIAYLWVRSLQLNEQVYMAMLSRGYRQEPVVLNDFKIRIKDWVWLLGVLAVISSTFLLRG